jgi:DNA-binding transcriptional LysR family regulator
MIRQFQYLAALAQERHFARAATSCNVTQSTLSAGIKHLEESLGVLIVARNQRFVGFTDEGARVLFWAQHFLADYSTLKQEIGRTEGGLAGHITIGAIPVAEAAAALLTAGFAARHPEVHITVRSLSSTEIRRGLGDFTLDVGLTYLDERKSTFLHSIPLYRESYVLATSKTGALRKRKSIRWREAARFSLCLLTHEMENRRIIDKHFHSAGVEVQPSLETNSLNSLWFHLHSGSWSSILPHTFLPLLEKDDKLMGIPLVEPRVSSLIGFLVADRDPFPPVVRALLDVAGSLDIQKQLTPSALGDPVAARRGRGPRR